MKKIKYGLLMLLSSLSLSFITTKDVQAEVFGTENEAVIESNSTIDSYFQQLKTSPEYNIIFSDDVNIDTKDSVYLDYLQNEDISSNSINVIYNPQELIYYLVVGDDLKNGIVTDNMEYMLQSPYAEMKLANNELEVGLSELGDNILSVMQMSAIGDNLYDYEGEWQPTIVEEFVEQEETSALKNILNNSKKLVVFSVLVAITIIALILVQVINENSLLSKHLDKKRKRKIMKQAELDIPEYLEMFDDSLTKGYLKTFEVLGIDTTESVLKDKEYVYNSLYNFLDKKDIRELLTTNVKNLTKVGLENSEEYILEKRKRELTLIITKMYSDIPQEVLKLTSFNRTLMREDFSLELLETFIIEEKELYDKNISLRKEFIEKELKNLLEIVCFELTSEEKEKLNAINDLLIVNYRKDYGKPEEAINKKYMGLINDYLRDIRLSKEDLTPQVIKALKEEHTSEELVKAQKQIFNRFVQNIIILQ